MKYVVFGGSGRTGRLIVQGLLDQGHSVVATYRSLQSEVVVSRSGAAAASVDLTTASVAELTELVRGADGIVFAAGAQSLADAGSVDGDGAMNVIAAARAAGVRRMVQISSIGAGSSIPAEASGPAYAAFYEAKRRSDARLRDSGLDWTIIEPGWLNDSRGTGLVQLATSGLPASGTPRADVAAAVVYTLMAPATAGLQFELIGGSTPIPEAIDGLSSRPRQ